MAKKRITLALEGVNEPRNIAWYIGTPHQDILNTIRAVSPFAVTDGWEGCLRERHASPVFIQCSDTFIMDRISIFSSKLFYLFLITFVNIIKSFMFFILFNISLFA